MKTLHVLILEDDLLTLSNLVREIHFLEENLIQSDTPRDIALTILAEYTQVEEYLNKTEHIKFDAILLDRDCKACGSYHVLDFEKYGKDKIISISTTPQWNKEAVEAGIERVVYKDHSQMEKFAKKVVEEIKKMIK